MPLSQYKELEMVSYATSGVQLRQKQVALGILY